jgi:uncharacterized protein (DUF58 family)
MILPSRSMLWVAGSIFLLSIPAAFWPALSFFWLICAAAVTGGIFIDAALTLRLKPPAVTRQINNSIAINNWNNVRLTIHNQQRVVLSFYLKDSLPENCQSEQKATIIALAPNQALEITYHLKALVRGNIQFNNAAVRLISPLRLWLRQFNLALPQTVRCYPDFTPITQLALETSITQANIGLHLYRKRGEGTDFEALREYRSGDSLRQIDWKATTRFGKVISREYRDERNQRIFIMLDAGRRMGSKTDELCHFDHALNAALLLSYVSLRYGDSVGLMSFGGDDRYLPPRHAAPTINKILHEIYDLQPTLSASDFEKAAQSVMQRERKRSLIVLFTNLRDEDEQNLVAAVKLLKTKHLVLVASLREAELDNARAINVSDTDSALLKASASEYMAQRNKVLTRLNKAGVMCIDVQPQHLAIESVNHYLQIKAAGKL